MKRKLAGSRAEPRWHERGAPGGIGFTLIELLVVIAIIRDTGGDAAPGTIKSQSFSASRRLR